MAARRKTKKPANSRATVRDVLSAVLGLNERIDDTSARIDRTLEGQVHLSEQVADVKGCVNRLEKVTNERLHEMEGDIATIKRPWLILASGWSKAVALSGFATAATATIVKLELWRYFPI